MESSKLEEVVKVAKNRNILYYPVNTKYIVELDTGLIFSINLRSGVVYVESVQMPGGRLMTVPLSDVFAKKQDALRVMIERSNFAITKLREKINSFEKDIEELDLGMIK